MTVPVGVAVGVAVLVGVAVGVNVPVGVAVGVLVGVAVLVGVGVSAMGCTPHQKPEQSPYPPSVATPTTAWPTVTSKV